ALDPVSTLLTAIRDLLELERPANYEVINFIGTQTAQTSQNYVKVVEWIPKAPGGVLKEISITNDPNAMIRLVVGNKEMFKDVTLLGVLTLDYQRMWVPG